MIAQGEESERPRAVTVIGWLWLVLASVFMMKALVNLLTYTVLRATSPGLLRALERMSPQVAFLGPLLRHAGALFAGQALAWAVVLVCAFFLLRRRPWARLATQAVCWANLAYLTLFTVFWVRVWSSAALAGQDPSLTPSRRALVLAAVVCVYVLVGAALVVMIGFLRSARVRAAFAPEKSAGR